MSSTCVFGLTSPKACRHSRSSHTGKITSALIPIWASQPAEAEPAEAEWDISELVDDAIPAEAAELAARISLLTRQGVVLVTAALTEDGALDAGLSGQITARRYVGGDAAEDVPAGLVIAGADDVVEDLLLGRRGVADIPGHVSSADAARTRRNRWLGKGNRGRRP